MLTSQPAADQAPAFAPADRRVLARVRQWPAPAFLAAVVVVAGAAAQVRVWAVDRGLWHDELYVAFNLQHKSYLRMAGGLYWNQTAPPGWLIVEKAIYQVLGGSEHWLRLPQLLASIAVLVLTVVIAWQAIGRWAAPLAGALVAISPMTLYYAGELKQYAVESCAALVIILCGARFAPTRRQALWFAGLTTPAMAASYSGLIVLGGVVAGLLLVFGMAKQWRACGIAVLAALPALAVGGAQVLLLKRFGNFLPDLVDGYFADGVPPRDAGPADIVAWLPRMWTAFVETTVYGGWAPAVLVVMLAGVIGLWVRGQRRWASLFAGVFGAAVGAAAVGGLPIVDRVALYLVAPVMLMLAAGVDAAVRVAMARRWALLPASVVVLVLAVTAVQPVVQRGVGQIERPLTIAPYQRAQGDAGYDNGRAMMRQVAQGFRPGDVVLSYVYSQPLVSWYGERYGLPVVGYVDLRQDCDSGAVSRALGEARRVWYVRGVHLSHHPGDLHAHVLQELARSGTVAGSWMYGSVPIVEPQPGWVLFDLTAGPDPAPPRPATPPPGCLTVI